jgi:hypothetical protein
MRLARHVKCVRETRNAYNVLVGKRIGNRNMEGPGAEGRTTLRRDH